MVPTWLPYVALISLSAGWIAVIVTLVMMIKAKRAQRLAAEARARQASGETP